MQTQVIFTKRSKSDGLSYILGSKIFTDTPKDEIKSFVSRALSVYQEINHPNDINYILCQREREFDTWGVPVNLNLNNEI